MFILFPAIGCRSDRIDTNQTRLVRDEDAVRGLVLGEPGTGKTVLKQALLNQTKRTRIGARPPRKNPPHSADSLTANQLCKDKTKEARRGSVELSSNEKAQNAGFRIEANASARGGSKAVANLLEAFPEPGDSTNNGSPQQQPL